MTDKEPIASPYQIDFSTYEDSFDTYDDLPATTSWLHSIGAALGKKFGLKVVQNPEQDWTLDYSKKEMQVGSFEDIYTRRGVLGLLLNGVGRLVFGARLPVSKTDIAKFVTDNQVDKKLGKHVVALTRTIDEIRTDDAIAHEYAGGERVVDTMHAQAYEAANKALQQMALDMRARREMARMVLEWMKNMAIFIKKVDKENHKNAPAANLVKEANDLIKEWQSPEMTAALQVSLGSIMQKIDASKTGVTTGRVYAIILTALYPQDTDAIMKVMVRCYPRNVGLLNNFFGYVVAERQHETDLIKVASRLQSDVDELKLFSSHTGGHAQYVIAKAEQYYHAFSLGIKFVSPYVGYDMEAKALEVEAANEAAHDIASKMVDYGIAKDIPGSIQLAKELLPLIEPFPFLDLNDQQKKNSQSGSMMKRVAGGQGQGNRKQKRQKEREKKSQSDRAKDRKKMEAIDNKKNQQKVDKERGGYSIFQKGRFDPLEAYTYIIGPYLSRINAMSAKFRRILKVNDPAGLRGAYNRGKALNSRILYRHRLNDFRLFARKEVEKDQSYGFVITSDISGSTESRYGGSQRMIQDEVMAAGFLVAEVAERIGEKVMCSLAVFDDEVQEVKRAGFYLNRASIMKKIEHHGGGTNVEEAGTALNVELQEMEEFKMKNKTIIFITDGSFYHQYFLETIKAAKKYKASIAYFQISDDVSSGVRMCKDLEQFVHQNAKGVRVRTRNITTKAINTLPEAMAQLMQETIGVSER